MALKKKARSRFIRYLGKQFRDDSTILQLYSRDMAELPSLTKILYKNIPDAVILPRNTEDIQKIYQIANENNVSITPRSGGTAGFGGAITYKKGIVVDCKGIESELYIDPLEQTVTASPSIIFSDLQRQLKQQGFSLCAFPSSYYSATIGGWIAHGGFGVGSSQYGGALDQIVNLEVVLPNGELKIYDKSENLALFVGSHGTLGIITKISL
ncbi:MAG: FAD-binding oxidoreductase, partial [Candidatus Heimdallarchaeota archaeon]